MAKTSVSFDDSLYVRIRAAAGPLGVSRWLADAAEAHLRSEALLVIANEIARESGGPYSDTELQEAGAWLSSSTPVV